MSERQTFAKIGPKILAEVAVPNGSAGRLSAAQPDPAKAATDAKFGLIVQALSTNTISVWIGDSTVTNANGLELQPGKSVELPISDASTVYAYAAGANQKLRVLYV